MTDKDKVNDIKGSVLKKKTQSIKDKATNNLVISQSKIVSNHFESQ